MRDLNYYKENVNLASLAQDMGYAVNKEKTSPKWICLDKPDSGDRILIFKTDNGQYRFKSVYSDSDKGSVIDFIQNRTKANLGEVRKILDDFLSNKSIAAEKFILSPSAKQDKDILIDHFRLQSFTDTKYLESRGISLETINSETFKNRIFNYQFLDKSGNSHQNTAFPVYNELGICGLEQKNFNYRGQLEGSLKANGFWRSNVDLKAPIDKIIVTEAPVDALSHYQLNPAARKENNLYLSSLGEMSPRQLDQVEKFVELYKPKTFCPAFDNDTAGERLLLKLQGHLQKPDYFVKDEYLKNQPGESCMKISIDKIDNHNYGVNFIVSARSLEESVKTVAKFKDKFEVLNEQLRGVSVEGTPYNFQAKNLSDHSAIARVSFVNLKEHWQKVNDLVKELKFDNSPKMEVLRSQGKDFNEDLTNFLKQGQQQFVKLMR